MNSRQGKSNSLLMGAYGLCDELLVDSSLSYFEKSSEILKILELPNIVAELGLLRKDILNSESFRELNGESERYTRILHLFPGRYYVIQLLELFNRSQEIIGSDSHRAFFLILFGDNSYFGDNGDIFLSLFRGIEQLDFGKMGRISDYEIYGF